MSGNPLLKGFAAPHPGEFLREDVLPATALSKVDVARRLGISRAMLYAILDESAPVSPAMALRLARLLGGSAESWLNMQRDYDLRVLESEMADELSTIEPVAA